MKMKKFIKIIITLMITILTIALGMVSSRAIMISTLGELMTSPNVNNTIYIGNSVNSFYANSNVYCIAHSMHVPSNTLFKVQEYIEIEGNNATNSAGKTVTSAENGYLAYLLGGGYGSRGYGNSYGNVTDRQRLLWRSYYTWYADVGRYLGLYAIGDAEAGTSWTQSATELYNQALAYATNSEWCIANGYGTAEIKNMGPSTVITSNVVAGPFKVAYSGKISSVVVKDNEGNEISGLRFFLDEKCQEEVSAENIVSGKNFYIYNGTGKKLKNLTVNVQASGSIKARIWFLKSTVSSDQDLIVVDTSRAPSNANVNIELKTYSSMQIKKVDEKTGKAIEGVGFKIYTSKGGWLQKTSEGWKYDAKQEDATEFFTKANGETEKIEDLELIKYNVWETTGIPNLYDLELQKGYNNTYKGVKVNSSVIVLDGSQETLKIEHKNQKTIGDLEIAKLDAKSKKPLDGVEFKIKTTTGKDTWLSENTDGTYNYSSTKANAKTYVTTNGKGVIISKLKLGTYNIYESKTASGYDLTLQENYDSATGWVNFGTVKIETSNDGSTSKIVKTYSNWKSINIKGYVWLDIPEMKLYKTNSRYDKDGENKVPGVTVNLRAKGTNTIIATTKTDKNGEYIFEKKVTEGNIKNYYVEFKYKGVTFKAKATRESTEESIIDVSKCIPVAFNSENAKEIVANGSRAMMSSVAYKDVDLSGIATTYTGTNTEKETTYGLSGNLFENSAKTGLYNESTSTLENINLGIKQIIDPDYSLSETISYVKIVMKGYTYTYRYGGTSNENFVEAPQIHWQTTTSLRYAFRQTIYPEDVAYDVKNSTEELKVYVGYKIGIKNTERAKTDDIYSEKELRVTSITNKFDTSRYELNDKNWKANGNVATIEESYLKDIKEKGIQSEQLATKFIEFSVKHDAILEILDTVKNPDGIIEKYPTEVTTSAYHLYTRNDYSWANDILKKQTHQTEDKTKTAQAPYMIFKLGANRVISGKVFEDKAITTDGQKLGNGKYDNENLVSNVKVELIDADGKTVSNLYDVDKNKQVNNKEERAISREAVTTSNTKGEYSLTGIVPGDYFVRFTYGDGTQKIYDPTGQQVKVEQVKSKDYKSTIVTSSVAKNAILNGNKEAATKHEWYKKDEIKKGIYSVAVDDLRDNNMTSRKAANEDPTKNVLASTAELSISVENDTKTTGDAEKTGNNQGASKQLNTYIGFNLGIIKQPEQKVDIAKVITNIKLTNAQNNLVFDGNPESGTLKGVSDLDGLKNGGSTYARAEIEEETIYGSKVELTYGIKVTNISDVNYYGSNYYWFGNSNGLPEVTLKVEEITDYLDATLNLIENDKVTVKSENEIVITELKDEVLYTEKNAKRKTDNKTTSGTATLGATRVLSSEDDDLEIINRAKVTKASNASEPNDRNSAENIRTVPAISLDGKEAEAVLIVTPPTGADKQTPILYIITITATLAILATGIFVIKKKVV